MTAMRVLMMQRADRCGLTTCDMRPPAGARQLADLAFAFRAAIPTEMLDLLGVMDGQPQAARPLFGRWRLMGVDETLASRLVLDDLTAQGDFGGEPVRADPGVRPAWWLSGWLPFAANGAGDHLCLDLAPATSGTPGQVIEFLHEDGRRRCLGSNLREWMNTH